VEFSNQKKKNKQSCAEGISLLFPGQIESPVRDEPDLDLVSTLLNSSLQETDVSTKWNCFENRLLYNLNRSDEGNLFFDGIGCGYGIVDLLVKLSYRQQVRSDNDRWNCCELRLMYQLLLLLLH
jgi:hypothetical protein